MANAKQISLRKEEGHPQVTASGEEIFPARLRRAPKWQRKFLRSLARSPNVALAAKRAQRSRTHVYRVREQDPAFAEAWKNSIESALDELEGTAFALAKRGDSQLISWLLRCHRPSVYRETQRTEHAIIGRIVILPEKEIADA